MHDPNCDPNEHDVYLTTQEFLNDPDMVSFYDGNYSAYLIDAQWALNNIHN